MTDHTTTTFTRGYMYGFTCTCGHRSLNFCTASEAEAHAKRHEETA